MGAVNGDLNRRRGQIDKMEPRPGNVVIKVRASGVNRLEHYLREGSVLTDITAVVGAGGRSRRPTR